MSTFACCAQDSLLSAKFDYNGDEFSPEMNEHIRKHRNTLSGYMGTLFTRSKDFRPAMDTACEVGAAVIKFKVKGNGLAEVACT